MYYLHGQHIMELTSRLQRFIRMFKLEMPETLTFEKIENGYRVQVEFIEGMESTRAAKFLYDENGINLFEKNNN